MQICQHLLWYVWRMILLLFLLQRATIINYHSAHINGVGWCTVQNWYCVWRNGREAYLCVFKLKETHSDLQLFIMNLTFSYCIKSILDLFLQCRRDLQRFWLNSNPKKLALSRCEGEKKQEWFLFQVISAIKSPDCGEKQPSDLGAFLKASQNRL